MQHNAILRAVVRFTRRELRSRCGMKDAAVRVHLERLLAMEYVWLVAVKNGPRFEYELLFDGALERAASQMMGLIDVEALRASRLPIPRRPGIAGWRFVRSRIRTP